MKNNFEDKLKEKVEDLTLTLRNQKTSSSDFRIFESFKVDEMTLSSLIRRAIHLVEESTASSFLDLISEKNNEVITSKNRNLNRSWAEYQIKDKRRIDLLFEFDDSFAIGVENKPWAWNQKDQLKDYAEGLQNRYKDRNWALVYLCESEPDEYTLGLENQYRNRIIHLTFKEFCQWLRAHGNALKSDEKWLVGAFLTTLANEIETTVIRSNNMNVEVAKLFDKDGIFSTDSSWEVLEEIYRYRNDFLARKINEFFENFSHEEWEIASNRLPWQDEREEGKREVDEQALAYSGFNLKLPCVEDWVVRIEFDASGFRNAFIGVLHKDYIKGHLPQWLEMLENLEKPTVRWKSSPSWARWEWFESDYLNWNKPEFIDIHGKEMLKKQINPILTTIKKAWDYQVDKES